MRTAALVVLVLLAAASSRAAELTASAVLSQQSVALGEQLVLSVAISGSGSAAPKPPVIPDVEIYESGKSQSMSIINGRVSSSVVHTYVLAPRKAGRFTVPPIEVAGAAPTAPITFDVGSSPAPAPAQPGTPAAPPAAAQPQGGAGQAQSPDAFVEAKLEKNRAYVNEQVTLVVRFYWAVPLLGAAQLEPPKLTGILSENASERQGTTMVGGRPYNFSELKSALFPVQTGRASIGPAIVTVQVPRRGAASTGDDFFDRMFNMAAPETRRLRTEPLAMEAEPLPPGAPDDFSGVVGALTIESSADRAELRAGEALSLTVKVSGIGNIKSLPEPKRPELPSARFFEAASTFVLERVGDKVGGSKTFKMVVVPKVSGPLEIPPVTVSFFDPAKRAYVRAQSRPIRLIVRPGDPKAALPASGPGAAVPGVTEVASDIRYLKAPGGEGPASKLADALAAFGEPGPWHALPGAFLLASILVAWRRGVRAANPRALRSSEARSAAEQRLRKAEAQPDAERARAVALLGEALTGYLADKLDQSSASLTLKTAVQRLQENKTPVEVSRIARLKSVWDELDLLRYAPGGVDRAEVKRLADEIRGLMLVFDKELRS